MKTPTSLPLKVSVSEHALLQRVNRKLAKNHERLCKTRRRLLPLVLLRPQHVPRTRSRASSQIIDSKADVEKFARKLGVLQNHEVVK